MRRRRRRKTVTDFEFSVDLTGGLWAVYRAGEDVEVVEARAGGEWGGATGGRDA